MIGAWRARGSSAALLGNRIKTWWRKLCRRFLLLHAEPVVPNYRLPKTLSSLLVAIVEQSSWSDMKGGQNLACPGYSRFEENRDGNQQGCH